MWIQKTIVIDKKARGFHIITDQVTNKLSEIKQIKVGLLHLYLKHTSASLTINENADQTVRVDFENFFNKLISENQINYRHSIEGPDDMPAHIKSSILGPFISIPITNGKLNLGTWQGIYLCEHRNLGKKRKLIATLQGSYNI